MTTPPIPDGSPLDEWDGPHPTVWGESKADEWDRPPVNVWGGPASATEPPTPTRPDDGLDDWARSPVAWIFGVLCVLGLVVVLHNFGPAAIGFLAAGVLATVLLVLTAVVGAWILRHIRPFTNVPLGRTLACLAWGLTAATGFAILANTGLSAIWARAISVNFANNWGDAFTAPINEETLKLAGLVLLTLIASPWIRGPLDGFVYGSLIGLGFQSMENWTYAINAIFTSSGTDPIGSVVQSAFSRVVFTGFGSHWAMSAVAGAGLGFLLTSRRSLGRILIGAGLILLALTMHWFFNSPLLSSGLGSIPKALINLVIVLVVFFWLRHRIRRAAIAAGADKALLSRRGRNRVLKGQPSATREQMDTWISTVEDRAYAET